MTKKNVTERTMNSITVDLEHKQLLVSATFLRNAGKYGSKEAEALNLRMAEYPTFTIAKKIPEKAKNAYLGLTVEKMATWLYDNEGLTAVKTLQTVITEAEKYNRSSYPVAKKWFIENYGAKFNGKKEEAEFDLNTFVASVTKVAKAA